MSPLALAVIEKQVKERMLYASTHQSLKSAFGPEFIAEDIQIASKDEISAKTPTTPTTPTVSTGNWKDRESDELLSSSEKNIREAVSSCCPFKYKLILSHFFLLFLFFSGLLDSPGKHCP